MVIQKIKNYYNKLKEIYKNDPVKNCAVYKDIDNGRCAHVDGFLCDMKTCIILKDYNKSITNVDSK